MDRSSWSAISKDSEIWKKIGIAAGSLLLLLPTPIALGLINTDLEAEVQRQQSKDPAADPRDTLPSTDDLLSLVTSGIGPTFLYLLSLVLFAIPTIGVLLAQAQLYIYFRPVNELMPELHTQVKVSIVSLFLFALIGLVSLALQAIASAMLPVALAQYSRGKDLIPALDVPRNAMTVVEMGGDYWKKAAGLVLASWGMLAANFIGMPWFMNIPISFLLCALAFVSMVLASRCALDHLTAVLPPMELLPLPDQDA